MSYIALISISKAISHSWFRLSDWQHQFSTLLQRVPPAYILTVHNPPYFLNDIPLSSEISQVVPLDLFPPLSPWLSVHSFTGGNESRPGHGGSISLFLHIVLLILFRYSQIFPDSQDLQLGIDKVVVFNGSVIKYQHGAVERTGLSTDYIEHVYRCFGIC